MKETVQVELLQSWHGIAKGKVLDCGPSRAKKLVEAKIGRLVKKQQVKADPFAAVRAELDQLREQLGDATDEGEKQSLAGAIAALEKKMAK